MCDIKRHKNSQQHIPGRVEERACRTSGAACVKLGGRDLGYVVLYGFFGFQNVIKNF